MTNRASELCQKGEGQGGTSRVHRILLMGNPNVGKSVFFSRLTGANVIASNYPGTTIDFSKGKMRLAGRSVEIIDVPGTYSLEPTNQAESVAVSMLDATTDRDVVVNVVDATNLERNLYLTMELLEKGTRMLVALNMWDETTHLGISIDRDELENLLGVPVVPTVALTGEGFRELVDRIPKSRKSDRFKPTTEHERWARVGTTARRVSTIEHRDHTPWETISDATVKPATGLPIALAVILISFYAVRIVGEGLIAHVLEPLFNLYTPIATAISEGIGPGLVHDILIGQLIEGEIDYVQSMGLLTTGIFVPFGMVLPYIVAFFFVLSLLEDVGYLPRLAVLVDTLFHRLGIHGHAIITVFLGLGCNVPGALSTRVMETKRERFISATLLAVSVPCMAQIAMVFGILGSYGMGYVAIVFTTLVGIYVVVGLVLNHFMKGESPELFTEIPPYRRPSITSLAKKTWMRIRSFVQEAVPFVFLGVFIINILYATGAISALGDLLAPVVTGLWGLPEEATAALLVGFLRKDVAVGMLIPLEMTALQLVIAATILTVYFPCVATFAVLVRELGLRDMAKSTLIMITAALIVGTLMRLVLLGA